MALTSVESRRATSDCGPRDDAGRLPYARRTSRSTGGVCGALPHNGMTTVARALSIALCTLLVSTSAWASDKEEAERHFRAGVSLQKVEDFDSAILQFETSIRLHPTKSALFNLANCLRAVHRYPEAHAALRRLVDEYDSELDPEMSLAAKSQLEELANLTATLWVDVDRPGAEIRVDGLTVATSPMAAPVVLGLGVHGVEVALDGYSSQRLEVSLTSRQRASRSVTLVPLAPNATPAAATPTARAVTPTPPRAESGRDETTGLYPWSWVVTGAGAAAVLAGAATGIGALALDSSLSSTCFDGVCPSDRESDVQRLHTLTTTTNVLLGVGAAVTAAGVVMLVLDSSSSSSSPAVGFGWSPTGAWASAQWGF